MNHEIPNLDQQGLRKFGLTFAAIIAVLFGILLPFIFSSSYPYWPWLLALLFIAWSLIASQTLDRFYRAWMRFGFFMGSIINRVLLTAVFFIVVFPTGLIFKITGKDPMRRKWDKNLPSYRTIPEKIDEIHMDKPF